MAKTETKDEKRARSQARAQLDSIVGMVKRLNHCQECDGADCELSDEEILTGINIFYKEGMKASPEDHKEYHDEEAIRQTIQEDPLSLEVRSDWHSPGEDSGPLDFMILLCTGGPAVRIIGELDEHQQPESAAIEYQDWFTPWERYGGTTSEEDEILLTYALQFYFGEC
ncbi:hypothetical protein ES703_49775 [subsurface metagenome]